MTGSITVFAAAILSMPKLAAASEVAAAGASAIFGCEPQATAEDRREVRCDLVATGAAQRLRFTARFSGSHDDTRVWIVPTLNGAPLACGDGSQTSLTGEDGDVTLTCRFSLQERAGTQHVLRVRVAWHHAQYTDISLERD